MRETAASERVTLLIGETTFTTTRTTLVPSAVLTRLTTLHSPDEGSYFVDADPGLFSHILRYLRTGMYPLFYDSTNGHDEPQYLALLNQARFYEIGKLEDWLTSKEYLNVVQRRTWAKSMTLCGETQIEHLEELTHLRNETLTILTVKESRETCFRCPKSNWRHDGRKVNCLKANCVPKDRASWAALYEVEMRVLRIDYVVTSVEVDQALLSPSDDGQASAPPPYHDP